MRKYGKQIAAICVGLVCLTLALGVYASGNTGAGNGGVSEGGVGGDGLWNEGNTVTGDGRADGHLTGGGTMVDHGADGNNSGTNGGTSANITSSPIFFILSHGILISGDWEKPNFPLSPGTKIAVILPSHRSNS